MPIYAGIAEIADELILGAEQGGIQRLLVPADVMESVFWEAAGPLIGDDERSAVLLAGMTVCAADGMLVNLADTPANRAMFGCTGTAEQDGEAAAPFPQLRIVALTARAGRSMLRAILGSTRAGDAARAAASAAAPSAFTDE